MNAACLKQGNAMVTLKYVSISFGALINRYFSIECENFTQALLTFVIIMSINFIMKAVVKNVIRLRKLRTNTHTSHVNTRAQTLTHTRTHTHTHTHTHTYAYKNTIFMVMACIAFIYLHHIIMIIIFIILIAS